MIKKGCAWQTLGFIRKKKDKSLVALVNVKQKLILCMWKNYAKNVDDVKVIVWELQHRLVAIDLNKKVLKRIVRKQRITRKIWKLNETNKSKILKKSERANKNRRA